MSQLDARKLQLLEGFYRIIGNKSKYWEIRGNILKQYDPHGLFPESKEMAIEYGDLGESSDSVLKRSGKARYDVKIVFVTGIQKGEEKPLEFTSFGAITEEGRKAFFSGVREYEIERITQKEIEDIENDFDQIEAPPGPYTIQPDKQGKLVWLSGAPGMGKSTSAQYLAKDHGFVYYEADAFGLLQNPFNNLESDNPSLATSAQRVLRGPGAEERAEITRTAMPIFQKIFVGEMAALDHEAMGAYYAAMARDIKTQRGRIGGDWAVAHVVLYKEWRDIMREILGPDLIFINLKMSLEEKNKRLLKRHSGNKQVVELMENFDKLMSKNDSDMLQLEVTGEMTREEVVNLIRDTINNIN